MFSPIFNTPDLSHTLLTQNM